MRGIIIAIFLSGIGAGPNSGSHPRMPYTSNFTGTSSHYVTQTAKQNKSIKKEDKDIIKHLEILKDMSMYEDLALYRYMKVFGQEEK